VSHDKTGVQRKNLSGHAYPPAAYRAGAVRKSPPGVIDTDYVPGPALFKVHAHRLHLCHINCRGGLGVVTSSHFALDSHGRVLWPLLNDHYRKLRNLLMCHHTGDIRLGAMPVGTGSTKST
jgi:hypothetical protein